MSLLFFLFSPRLTTFFFFFFNDTATTEIYTLSLHDALPISHLVSRKSQGIIQAVQQGAGIHPRFSLVRVDRKSTRLNSSHLVISYAVFCLKKKKKNIELLGLNVSCQSSRECERRQ